MEDNTFLKEIGKRIRNVRKEKHLSQADLAFQADVSLPHISDIENGKTSMSVITFFKIIEALKTSADFILRPDIPTVNTMYQTQFSDLLSDCSPSEIESIIVIVKELKNTMRANKKD